MSRLDTAVAARVGETPAPATFDALIRSVLLDATGVRHLVLCLAFNSLVAHHCPKIGDRLLRVLNTVLCSEDARSRSHPAAVSTLTGRRARKGGVAWDFKASPVLEAWMADRFRGLDDPRVPPVPPGEDIRRAVRCPGVATVWRVTVRPVPERADMCVSYKTHTRKTPQTEVIAAVGREDNAVRKLWDFYSFSAHPAAVKEYVSALREAALAFDPRLRDEVPKLLPGLYAAYLEVARSGD